MAGAFLPAAVLQVTDAAEAWCECGGSDRSLPQRGRSSNNSQWLIPTVEALMIYLFGNWGAMGGLGTIDNKTQDPGEGIFWDLAPVSHLSGVSESMSGVRGSLHQKSSYWHWFMIYNAF